MPREEEDRGSRRRREEDDEPRSSRRSDDDGDRGSSRRRSDEDDRGSRRSREDDDRGSRRRSDDEGDADRGSRSRGDSDYTYERRTAEQVKDRRQKQENGDFDKIVKPHIKQWKPNDGDNRIRIVPPTWKKPQHHGFDLKVHYGVGADRQSYLCLHAMKGEPDPIHEAWEAAKRELNEDEENKALKEYVKDLKAKPRTGVYLVDRDHEKEGVQFWAMPQGMDADIVAVMTDKRSGEVLPIDDPEDGYDIEFVKTGKGINTEYKGIAIARRSSPLGKKEWLEFAVENPIPDVLQYFDYDHIAKAFGGKGQQKTGRDREDDRGDRDRDDDRGRSRDREDDRRPSRDREDDRGGRSRSRDESSDEPTWASVHDMTKSELVDLIELKRLDIKPKEAKDDEDLADWVCEELKLKKPEKKEERRRSSDDDEGEDKLAKMRQRRERD